jgi:hypothetical protein
MWQEAIPRFSKYLWWYSSVSTTSATSVENTVWCFNEVNRADFAGPKLAFERLLTWYVLPWCRDLNLDLL